MTHPEANPPSGTPPPKDSLPTAPEETTDQKARARVAVARLAVVIFVGTALWFVPVPAGVQPRAWHLLAVFVATMVGIILRPIPMGAMAFVAAAFAVLSGPLTISAAPAAPPSTGLPCGGPHRFARETGFSSVASPWIRVRERSARS